MEIAFNLVLLAAGSLLPILTGKTVNGWRGWVLPLPAVLVFSILALVSLPEVLREGSVRFNLEWVPRLGVDLNLVLGGMGAIMALLVTGIGSLILIYATGYMKGHPLAGRLFIFLYAFMFSMYGLTVADHLLVFFIFWELTSVTSYLLIGFNHADQTARRNALQALIVTGLGGMALLAGIILLSTVAGTWYLSELPATAERVQADPAYLWILGLFLAGAFTKSAQVPFHFWLPNAMSAPTPVSAYLHSATMVKAGVFLLLLVVPVLGGTTAWTVTLVLCGGMTLLWGSVIGLQQYDLKKVLAGTTLAILGLITLLIGIGREMDLLAALLFLVGHALYKATLFMVAGSVDHEAGTRDIRLLGGLRKAMPWTAAAALLAALSKMGLPPFLGFLGKEYTYKASLTAEGHWVITLVLLAGNAMLLAIAVKVAILPFWKSRGELPSGHVHEAPWSMRTGPLVLASLGLLFGLLPGLVIPVFSSALAQVTGSPVPVSLKLWQGFNLPLLLTGVTIAAGLVMALWNKPLAGSLNRLPAALADRVYDALLEGVLRFAYWQTRFLQSGYLRNYIFIVLATTVTLSSIKLWRFGGIPGLGNVTVDSPAMWFVAALMVFAVGLAVTTKSRLAALLSLGLVGFGIAWIFVLYSAPDLAITQILVETLTVVLFAWVVSRLPGMRQLSSRRELLLDAGVSLFAGLLVTVLVLKSQALQIGEKISDSLAAWSYPEAHGANIVNVILVDFRALDTWGEITVLAIAAIGVWALATNFKPIKTGKK